MVFGQHNCVNLASFLTLLTICLETNVDCSQWLDDHQKCTTINKGAQQWAAFFPLFQWQSWADNLIKHAWNKFSNTRSNKCPWLQENAWWSKTPPSCFIGWWHDPLLWTFDGKSTPHAEWKKAFATKALATKNLLMTKWAHNKGEVHFAWAKCFLGKMNHKFHCREKMKQACHQLEEQNAGLKEQ